MPFNKESSLIDVSFPAGKAGKDLCCLRETIGYLDSKTGISWYAYSGLVSDGASIPSYLWSVIGHPFESCFLRAGLLHDQGYKDQIYSKDEVDTMFSHALLEDGNSRLTALMMYDGVKYGGFKAWNQHTREKALGLDPNSKFVEKWKVLTNG